MQVRKDYVKKHSWEMSVAEFIDYKCNQKLSNVKIGELKNVAPSTISIWCKKHKKELEKQGYLL